MYSSPSIQDTVSNKRIQSVDLVKIIAMVGVVVLHTMTKDFFYYVSVIAIPLFFMSMGYIQLGRPKMTIKYCLTKIWHIIKFVAIFTFCSWIIKHLIFAGNPFDIRALLEYMFSGYLQRGEFGVFWFFSAMIILYALLPFINILYTKYYRSFCALTIALLVIMSLVFLEDLFHLNFGWKSEQNIIQPLRLYNWLGYLCLGGMIKHSGFRSLGKWFYILAGIIIIYFFQLWLIPFIDNPHCEFFYASLPVVALCMCVFCFCLNLKIENSKVISLLSALFIYVYSLHIIVLKYTCILLDKFQLTSGPYQSFLFIYVLMISIVLSAILHRIPPIRRIFTI